MQVFAMTQKGTLSKENEDRIIIGKTILSNGFFRCDNHSGVVAVADGVGGNNAGAIASHYVAYRLGDMLSTSKEFLESVNKELLALSESNSDYHKMATTLSGFTYIDSCISSFHVGNSRIYAILGGRYLKQLTEDDTALTYLLKSGKLSPEEVDTYQDNNEITACFGGGDSNLLDLAITDNCDARTLLLVTDGVHNFVSIDELEGIIQNEEHYFPICRSIVNKAEQNGSSDDISVVIINIDEFMEG